MDGKNDPAAMKTKKTHPDSIAELLKAIAKKSKRRKLKYIGCWVKLYSDGSGCVNDQFGNRAGFGSIAECLEILKK